MPSDTIHRLGDLTVQRVTEQCGPGFAPDFLYPDWDPAFLAEHRDWMVPTCYDAAEQRFIASIHTWVVKTRHHVVLIDTCCGNHKERPQIPRFHQLDQPYLETLAAAGVAPEDVDYVLCTHLHADHCGWNTRLVDGRWVPTFPNARYVFSKAEHEHWSAPSGDADFNANVFEDSVLPVIASGQADLVDGEGAIGDAITIHPTPGHSPGHVAIRVRDGGAEGLFTGDAMHQPVQVFRPEWNSRFCADPTLARRSRRWILEEAAERQARVFSAHFAGPSVGTVSRRGDDFAWRFLETRA